jgi:hypothetical protein
MIKAKLTGMLLSRIDHDGRLACRPMAATGKLGRARHAAHVADSTGQEYGNASLQPRASTTGTPHPTLAGTTFPAGALPDMERLLPM